MNDDPARLIYAAGIRRRRSFGLFVRMLVAVIAVAAAYYALHEASLRGLVSLSLLDVGKLAAIILGGWFAIRAIYHFFSAIFRRSETIRIYDKGFLWARGGESKKHLWGQVVRFREGAHGWLFRRGAHVLTMSDGSIYAFTARHGNTAAFARAVRPFAARVTAARIGKALREGTVVQLHPKLTVHPEGIRAKDKTIRWGNLQIGVKGGRVVIRARTREGVKTAARLPLHQIDNAGGLLDLARSMYAQMRDARRVKATQVRPGTASYGSSRARATTPARAAARRR
ncbi:hypothetical protein FBR02_03700 [Anaerolineae bacterium CFX9]|nr:hypothetical protein [Anaerolineae bacterium CFX9]